MCAFASFFCGSPRTVYRCVQATGGDTTRSLCTLVSLTHVCCPTSSPPLFPMSVALICREASIAHSSMPRRAGVQVDVPRPRSRRLCPNGRRWLAGDVLARHRTRYRPYTHRPPMTPSVRIDQWRSPSSSGEFVDEGYRRIGTRVRPMGEALSQGLAPEAAKALGLLPGTLSGCPTSLATGKVA